MSEAVPFLTRARTLDHLGREQIADCPTAISELWKNSFDAYARNVALHIIDGDVPLAMVADNGHGMNRQDFVDYWLVIGTESKKSNKVKSRSDMNGLPERPKQGQKGIGRLSCAIMGSLLLIISKKKNDDFVASLIDWRLFENPYLYLHDIRLPVEEFSNKDDLFNLLPSMLDQLRGNLYGDISQDKDRASRINHAWKLFSELEVSQELEQQDKLVTTTISAIEKTLASTKYSSETLSKWDVWKELSDHGTALVISDVNPDITAQLAENSVDNTIVQAQMKFSSTLSNFSETYLGIERNIFDSFDKEYDFESSFKHEVSLWRSGKPYIILSPDEEFSSDNFDLCEHIISGEVDENGTFSGKVRSFHKDRGDVTIHSPYSVPTHLRSKVGKFHITVASFENLAKNTTLENDVFNYLTNLSKKFSGFLVYRDTLRVMPYGRDDNDFFEIEARRSKNAGLYHYSNRNTFGRLLITAENNKNLRDKAGREGFIDNKSSKVFKDIVNNILVTVSKRYIGRESEIRKVLQPQLNAAFNERKAKEEREKKKKRDQARFVGTLINNLESISELSKETEEFLLVYNEYKKTYDSEDLTLSHDKISEYKKQLNNLRLSGIPTKLGKAEIHYRKFRDDFQEIAFKLNDAQKEVGLLQEELNPKTPIELLDDRIERMTKSFSKGLRDSVKILSSEFDSERVRLDGVVESQIERIKSDYKDIRFSLKNDVISLQDSLSNVDLKKDKLDLEVESLFSTYMLSIDNLKNDIDLNTIATYDSEEFEKLQEEVSRLNGLAQLGITVEIISHELAHLDKSMNNIISTLVNQLGNTPEISTLQSTYDGISSKFAFLAPLRVSGSNKKQEIRGVDIELYINTFFNKLFLENNINIEYSDSFRNVSIRDDKSRVLPVFVNLVNNSRYWVCQSKSSERRIMIDFVDGEVMISDDGPGVDKDDIKNLFTIFFTKKSTGGRGIGLYLSRTNLAVSGHKIAYVMDKKRKLLNGANFSILFKGIKNV
jgi:signal transduction histidine kinase